MKTNTEKSKRMMKEMHKGDAVLTTAFRGAKVNMYKMIGKKYR